MHLTAVVKTLETMCFIVVLVGLLARIFRINQLNTGRREGLNCHVQQKQWVWRTERESSEGWISTVHSQTDRMYVPPWLKCIYILFLSVSFLSGCQNRARCLPRGSKDRRLLIQV